jgi:hypothetical protein
MEWWVQLSLLPNLDYRQDWPSAFNPDGGFCAAAFIDNTLIATCRPGWGGGDGEQAPRVPKDVQQAWWTGWKKLHGIKWQKVMLTNGMDLHVYGLASVRHNDNWMLKNSEMVVKFTAQARQEMQYKMFGDSAYTDGPYMVTGGGRGLASVRETIEWEYKDLKTYWKYCDYRHVLKIKGQPVGKIVFVSMLLRNLHSFMYANQAAKYFSFAGPRCTSIWSKVHAPVPCQTTASGAPLSTTLCCQVGGPAMKTRKMSLQID